VFNKHIKVAGNYQKFVMVDFSARLSGLPMIAFLSIEFISKF
jgi:hypothetical protein